MRRPFLVALLLVIAPRAAAQVPGWADFWRVANTTLAGPPPLATGPTGMFWNPAAVGDFSGLAAGIAVFQTPDVLGIGGLMAGATQRIGSGGAIGVVLGRLAVDDVIRTTTSPTAQQGEIPVYTQFLSVVAGLALDGVRAGAAVRGHDSRFDSADEDGVTADVGVRVTPTRGLTLAAATHFARPLLREGPGTAYYAGAELAITTTTIWGSRFLVIGQYGLAHEERAGMEHTLTAGLALDDRMRIDWGWAREQGYGDASWRSTLALWFRAGRYRIVVARGDGLNGLGATFRLGLQTEILR